MSLIWKTVELNRHGSMYWITFRGQRRHLDIDSPRFRTLGEDRRTMATNREDIQGMISELHVPSPHRSLERKTTDCFLHTLW